MEPSNQSPKKPVTAPAVKKGLKKGSSRRGQGKKKIIVSSIDMVNAVAASVAKEFDQSPDLKDSGAGDDSFLFQEGATSQETPRNGEDSASQRGADDSASMGKSMHSEEEEKRSDVRSSRNSVLTAGNNKSLGAGEATHEQFASPAKFERIVDSVKSEEKGTPSHEEASAADAHRQNEAIIKAEEEEQEAKRRHQAEVLAAEAASKQEAIVRAALLEAERNRVSGNLKSFQIDLERLKSQLSTFNIITPEGAEQSHKQLEELLQKSISFQLPKPESDFVQQEEFKSQLSYLDGGLREITVEKEKLLSSVQKRSLDAQQVASQYKAAIEKKDNEEKECFNRARTHLENKEFEAAFQELEKIELNHQEKTGMWIQVTQLQEKHEKEEAAKKAAQEEERFKQEQARQADEKAKVAAAAAKAHAEEESRVAALQAAKLEQIKREAEQAAQKAKDDELERQRVIREQVNKNTAEQARLKAEAEEKKRQDELLSLQQLEQEAKESAEAADEEPKAAAVPEQPVPKKASGCPFAAMAGAGAAAPHPIPAAAEAQEEEVKQEDVITTTGDVETKTTEGDGSSNFVKYAVIALIAGAAITGFVLFKKR